MRISPSRDIELSKPQLLDKAQQLDTYLKTLNAPQLAKIMRISPALAEKTQALIAKWTATPAEPSKALDSFRGDIYSGLQAPTFSAGDREYANQKLRILSGLYGIIRPHDGICPYRLEMGYKLPDSPFKNLYTFWGESIAACLPQEGPIVNLASEEYAQSITSFVDSSRIIAPKFLTWNAKTNEPTFIVVHAKIARGAFARWLIINRIQKMNELINFNDLGYRYNQELSTPNNPTFVCHEFDGKGLSLRLT